MNGETAEVPEQPGPNPAKIGHGADSEVKVITVLIGLGGAGFQRPGKGLSWWWMTSTMRTTLNDGKGVDLTSGRLLSKQKMWNSPTRVA